MSVTTISGSIGNFVTLGSGNYADNLTITTMGEVSTPNFQGTGVYNYAQVTLDDAASTLTNAGYILAGEEHGNDEFSFGVIGVSLANGYVNNTGGIFGGTGRYEGDTVGAVVSGGSLYNNGVISGGGFQPFSGPPSSYPLDFGVMQSDGTVTNAGYIRGGVGSAGLELTGGVFINENSIVSGEYDSGTQYVVAPGANVSGGVLINQGVISALEGRGSGFAGPVEAPGLVISGGTVINSGTIAPSANSPVPGVILSGGTLDNSGLISGAVRIDGTASMASTIDFANTGTVDGGIYATDARVFNSGLIEGGVSFYKGSAGLTLAAGSDITYGAGAVAFYTITTYGTGAGPHLPTITTIADVTVLDFAAGSIAGSLDMGGSFAGFNTINFDANAAWTLGGTAAELAAGQTISGFNHGDTLILDDFVQTSNTFINGALTLANATQSLTLDIAGNFTGLDVEDVAQGVEIAVCYLRGTPILTPSGERAIEDLRPGDPVMTRYAGVQKIKWIGEQLYARRFLQNNRDMLPVCITAGALGANTPLRDLFVSPGHSLLLEGTLVLAKHLVNGVTITQFWAPDEVHYYNIELDAHDCVRAAGAWAETYADCPGLRAKFHNAASFWAAHPTQVAPAEPRLCAQRPLHGPVLAAALTPVIAAAAAASSTGRLRGYVERMAHGGVSGWAQDEANPELPVWLDILRGGRLAARILAHEERADLRAAGLGSGRFGFSWAPAIGSARAEITVRRSGSIEILPPTHELRAAKAA